MEKPKPGELPAVAKEYMSEGNTGPVKDGRFACLELSDGSRVVGRIGQTFSDLRQDAVRLGLIAEPATEPKAKKAPSEKAAARPKTVKKLTKKAR